uniref:Aminotransferase class V domain-containing protein n=1 Tax=Glossina pallidipes TaxID=7398 RepID=A0A1B0AF14_GLOPL
MVHIPHEVFSDVFQMYPQFWGLGGGRIRWEVDRKELADIQFDKTNKRITVKDDPRVLDAMLPYLTNFYGNPHSRTHAYGWESERAVEKAREQVAHLIGADPKEIIFTSGATESNNIAVKEPNGIIDMQKMEKALTPDTALVSVMTVNNEIGVKQPDAEIGKLAYWLLTGYHSLPLSCTSLSPN